ncbi:MAG: hypothetical protein AAF063_03830 [Cyanobacteria bacterium J06643_5]
MVDSFESVTNNLEKSETFNSLILNYFQKFLNLLFFLPDDFDENSNLEGEGGEGGEGGGIIDNFLLYVPPGHAYANTVHCSLFTVCPSGTRLR